jgi:CBS domain-containing protein
MRVSEAMSRDVRIANPEQTICEAARIMSEIDVGALPVGENDKLVGMITDRDIAVRAVAAEKPHTTKVRDVMSREVLYCYEDQDLDELAINMGDEQVRRMPVVNRDKRLVGIVSVGDLAQTGNATTTGRAVADISTPGGQHSQTSGS